MELSVDEDDRSPKKVYSRQYLDCTLDSADTNEDDNMDDNDLNT